jgi:photosystem II stability/assembly factor-like uncharacterized protein
VKLLVIGNVKKWPGSLEKSREPVIFCGGAEKRRPAVKVTRGLLGTALLCAATLACAGQIAWAQDTASEQGRWERLGPEGGNVVSLAAGRGAVYLGTADGHVFASADGGGHWELRGRVGARLDGVVQRLLVDSREGRVFAAIWNLDPAAGGGVYHSEDGGKSWKLLGLRGEAVRALEQAASEPEVLVAGTRSGVFRSSDEGRNWERISREGDLELRNIDSLAIDPRDAKTIYAGTYHLPWKTTDGGNTWSGVTVGMIDDSDVMSLRVDSRNPARVFASACSGIYRSENGGTQWTKLQGVPYSARRTQAIEQDALDSQVLYAGTTEGFWVTRDVGETWARTTPRDWVVNAVAVTAGPNGGQRVILGTEKQGVMVSVDGGATFSSANMGFSHRVVSTLASDPRVTGHFLVRADEELWESRDGGKQWTMIASPTTEGVTRLFGTEAGWLAAVRGGGLASCDEETKKWKTLRLGRGRTARSAQKASAASTKAFIEMPSEVFGAAAHGGRLYVATDRGLWVGTVTEGLLARVAQSELPGGVGSVEVSARGEVLTASGSAIVRSMDDGKTWSGEKVPRAAEILWAHRIEQDGQNWLFVATKNGLLQRKEGADEDWALSQTGLPASPAEGLVALQGGFALFLRSGGVYVSHDAGRVWDRVDNWEVQGSFSGIARGGSGGFVMGSRSEGVLYRAP